jgi:hypothetical protein
LFNFNKNFFRTGIATVNFVDYQDDRQTKSESLGQHVTSLWQWAFSSVDQKNDPVYEGQSPLYFPTKVSVTWGINNVDQGASVVDACGFSENGDSALAFLIV